VYTVFITNTKHKGTNMENQNQNQEQTLAALGMDLEKFYKVPETREFENLIVEWYKKYGGSPFLDIKIIEENGEATGEVQIDMVKIFEEQVEEQFGEKTTEILADYVSALLLDFIENAPNLAEENTDSEEN
jgi:hypothetical protein